MTKKKRNCRGWQIRRLDTKFLRVAVPPDLCLERAALGGGQVGCTSVEVRLLALFRAD